MRFPPLQTPKEFLSMTSFFRRALLVLLALVLVACTGSTRTAERERPSPSASPSPTLPPPPPIAPLTGLVVASKGIVARPALAVKIDNHTSSRPQVGLERADVVYEEPVEGGITRFIAIFQSRDASKVGPIRSARLTDLDVLAQYGKPCLSFSGAARYVVRAVGRARVVSLRHGQFPAVYRRDGSRSAPHNLFSSTSGLWRVARRANPTPAPALFDFGTLLAPPPVVVPSPSPPPSGSPTATPTPAWPRSRTATIPFSGSAWRAVWRWHSTWGEYRRWQGSSPHRAASGEQISAANVIVMRVGTQRTNSQAAAHGTPELRLVGSGDMVLMRNGVRIAGKWRRASLYAPTKFVDKLGRELTLAPGNTWIELVPTRIVPRYT